MAANTPINVTDQATESSEAASTQVFGTTELLEHILIYVPARDVLLSQRVSQQWQAVITGSLSLQKLLSFVGEAAEPVQWAKEHLGSPRHGTSWYWDAQVIRVMPANPYAIFYRSSNTTVCFYVNDLVAKLLGVSNKALTHDDDDLTVLSSTTDLATYSLYESAKRPEASWRRMLLPGPGVVGDIVDTELTGLTGLAVCESVYNGVLLAAGSAEPDGCIRLGKLWSAAVKEQARRRGFNRLRDQD
ncbi:hypothetical protein LTR97_002551 [Elasticomyces elasticus]|uniref:F-box domain-containing protein n=1 Tax=Elasticomyces elasticus TaxID=574655 RepID=A0AAN7WGF4_9PEZI|nr:hypothetical protein LTR97_002551 [Elasticomyces elasticus]